MKIKCCTNDIANARQDSDPKPRTCNQYKRMIYMYHITMKRLNISKELITWRWCDSYTCSVPSNYSVWNYHLGIEEVELIDVMFIYTMIVQFYFVISDKVS